MTSGRRDFESLQHAAERIDCSVFTLREKISAGELPAYRFSNKPGAAIRVKVADVNALMRPVIPAEIYADRLGSAK
ncbi:DNA-binding protein [Mycobacterium alsense]|uniref:DNA-binding protein n=1 Tax=Mycobacterium alsense TaxID=324058 RepID=A0AA42BXW5_9MYCO|nr:DNA-binding protein [Mycobacterium alsense]